MHKPLRWWATCAGGITGGLAGTVPILLSGWGIGTGSGFRPTPESVQHLFVGAWSILIIGVVAGVGVGALIGALAGRWLAASMSALSGETRSVARQKGRPPTPVGTPFAEVHELGTAVSELCGVLETQQRLHDRVIHDLAHELRTPLTVLRSHIEAINDGIWAPTIDRMRLFEQEIVNLSQLVDDLDLLHQAEEDALSLRLEKVNPGDLLDDVAETFRPLFDEKGIIFRYEPLSEDTSAILDWEKVLRILSNLLTNAHKYTPQGEFVGLSGYVEDGLLTITVADTGCGIAKTDLNRIFERFQRGAVTRASVPGKGLGLTIARHLTEAQGGKLTVWSIEGKGSEFDVVLPLKPTAPFSVLCENAKGVAPTARQQVRGTRCL